MSYTPPPPPEVPPNPASVPPQAAPMQYPPAAYAPANPNAYGYAPVDPNEYPPAPVYNAPPPAPTSTGCRWGCIGLLVTIFLVVGVTGALMLGALTSGANAFGGAFGGLGNTIGNVLTTWGNAFNPPRRVPVVPQVERLQNLAELTTVKLNYAGVVTVRQDIPPLLAGLYGNEQVLVAVVSIRAGIDLRMLDNTDVLYDEAANTLTLRLPAPVLQECFMDDSKSYVVENRTGIFVGASPALSDEARRYAIEQFRNQALEEKILEEAQREGETVIREFMGVLNSEDTMPNLQFVFDAPDSNAIPPETCQT